MSPCIHFSMFSMLFCLHLFASRFALFALKQICGDTLLCKKDSFGCQNYLEFSSSWPAKFKPLAIKNIFKAKDCKSMLCFIPGTCRAFPLKSVQVSSFKAENYPSDEHPGINKSVLSLIHSPQIQPVGSREYCLKKKPIDFSYLHYYTSQK